MLFHLLGFGVSVLSVLLLYVSICVRPVKYRLIGFLALLGGAYLGYAEIYMPFEAARTHVPEVSTFMKGVIIFPFSLVTGLTCLLYGNRTADILGRPKEPTTTGWIVSIISLAVGYAIYVWLQVHLEDMGYVF